RIVIGADKAAGIIPHLLPLGFHFTRIVAFAAHYCCPWMFVAKLHKGPALLAFMGDFGYRTITRNPHQGQQEQGESMDSAAAERLADITTRIAHAQARFGAPPEKVELVAVSKTFPADAIEPFLAAGQRVF